LRLPVRFRFRDRAFADYDFTSLRGTFQDPILGDIGPEKQTHAWAAGGRVGYLVTPDLLTFVSGGFTEARFDAIIFRPVRFRSPTLAQLQFDPSHLRPVLAVLELSSRGPSAKHGRTRQPYGEGPADGHVRARVALQLQRLAVGDGKLRSASPC